MRLLKIVRHHLWWQIGLCLFIEVITILAIICLHYTDLHQPSPRLPLTYGTKIFTGTFILLTVLILPILEELGFRSWLKNNRGRKSYGFLLFSIYLAVALKWYSIIFIVVGILSIYYYPKKWWLIGLSSFTFALCHLKFLNLSVLSSVLFLNFLNKGVFFAIIYYRFGLKNSIAAHCIYNSLFVFFGGTELLLRDKLMPISAPVADGYIIKHSLFPNPDLFPNKMNSEEIRFSAIDASSLLKALLPSNDSTIYLYNGSANYYSVQLKPKEVRRASTDTAVKLLLFYMNVQYDTIATKITPVYTCKYLPKKTEDQIIVTSKYPKDVFDLVEELEQLYKYPISIDSVAHTRRIDYTINPSKSFASIVTELEKHGLHFKSSMKNITFISVHD